MPTTTQTAGAPVAGAAADQPEAPEGVTRVVMLASISGTRDGADWPPVGGELTLPATEAADLIRGSLARPAPEPVERAAIDRPAERAISEPLTRDRRA